MSWAKDNRWGIQKSRLRATAKMTTAAGSRAGMKSCPKWSVQGSPASVIHTVFTSSGVSPNLELNTASLFASFFKDSKL